MLSLNQNDVSIIKIECFEKKKKNLELAYCLCALTGCH